MRKRELRDDFGGVSLHPIVIRKAAKAVAINASDPDEGALFLDMLGLIPPLPGNEPVVATKHKRETKRKQNRKDYEAAKLRAQGITPEEVGDV